MVINGQIVTGEITETWDISATFAFMDATEGLLYTDEGHCIAWPNKVPDIFPGDPITFKMNAGWFVHPKTGGIVEFGGLMTNLMPA
jgi:hypothetical protein